MQTRQGITGMMVTVYVVHQLPRYRIWAAAFDVLYVSLEVEILSEAALIQTTHIYTFRSIVKVQDRKLETSV